jgi:Rrf2 family protein
MFRLSKRVEYGILSMQYIAEKEGTLVTAKEISENLSISFEFLAKTLQMLMKMKLIDSVKGIKGGYRLSRNASEISLEDIILALESKIAITDCLSEHSKDECSRTEDCTIKQPLGIIQNKIDDLFRAMKLEDLKMAKKVNLVQIEL